MNKLRYEWFVAAALALEIFLFSIVSPNFLSVFNAFECIRLGVEIGLLTLALTPVIITGGIDLSVGSMLGLCAVTFGSLHQDAGWNIPAAAFVTILVAIAGGILNGSLIAVLNVTPLIVTLGTFSLFRGIAEGLTGGAKNYSDFPASFLYLGQGYIAGVLPPQTLIFFAAFLFYAVLQHRTTIGRAFQAIGFSSSGARYAALPVARRLVLVYALSGLSAGVAALIYVAHLGQAKSDAGNGYELTAITAVVLGGTSIFGGSGSVPGSLLGIAAIVVVQNGLRLAALPAELAGILTGALLVGTIALERLLNLHSSTPATNALGHPQKKNLRLISVGAAALIAFICFYLVTRSRLSGHAAAHSEITVGMMPKSKGDPYFISCRLGAEEAARNEHVNLLWDGPTGLDAAKQNEVVEGWITRHVDAIAVAVENGPAISSVLRKARAQGIRVVTWDADASPDARDYFVDQATPQAIGYSLLDEAARLMHNQGEFAIITGALSAANQNQWISFIKDRARAKYPQMRLAVLRPSDDDRDKAFSESQTILKVYPKVKVIIVISAPAVPGAGEAVKQLGRDDVTVVGLSLPNLCKPYVHSGSVASVILWKTRDLGYLAVTAATALARGDLKPGANSFSAGRLGAVEIKGSDMILGVPFIFNKSNIDQFDF